VHLIGVSGGRPGPEAEDILARVRTVVISRSLIEEGTQIPASGARVHTYGRLEEALSILDEARRRGEEVAFVATGDPLLFGIGGLLRRRFGPEVLEIHPAPSTAQLAFARLRLPWEEFFFVSLHGGPRNFALEDLPGLLRLYGRVCVFTDPGCGPREIGAYLAPRVPEEHLRLVVAERMGLKGERIWEGPASRALGERFATPNLVLLLYDGPGRRHGFGLENEEIAHPRGLITKNEVRAVVLHRLNLPERGIFWDVGAGAGGVSVEAARLRPLLRVFAVERSPERLSFLEENRRRFGLLNLEVVAGEAPEALEGLPSPDRVFVGGSGGRLREILIHLAERGCREVVLTLVSLQHLAEALSLLRKEGFAVEATQVSVFRGRDLSGHTLLSPENPVFVLRAQRG